MQSDEKKALIEELESDGEQRVREKLANGDYGRRKLDAINQWLEKFDLIRKESDGIIREQKESFNRRISVWGVLIGLLGIVVAIYLATKI